MDQLTLWLILLVIAAVALSVMAGERRRRQHRRLERWMNQQFIEVERQRTEAWRSYRPEPGVVTTDVTRLRRAVARDEGATTDEG